MCELGDVKLRLYLVKCPENFDLRLDKWVRTCFEQSCVGHDPPPDVGANVAHMNPFNDFEDK